MYTPNPKINNHLTSWLILMFWVISLMIVVGGLTRLTDSGLSITEWQLFSGLFPPINDQDWIIYFNLYTSDYQFFKYDFIILNIVILCKCIKKDSNLVIILASITMLYV